MKAIHTPHSYEITSYGALGSAIISFAAFIGMFLSFSLLNQFPNVIYVSTMLAVVFHLGLLPLITNIPAPAWTKAGGYGWVVMDIILAVAGLNGVPNTTIEPLRFGVHTTLVIWPIGIAIANRGLLRGSSILFAITTGTVQLLGTLVSPQVRFIGFPFMVFWYIMVIRYLKSQKIVQEMREAGAKLDL